MKKKKKIDEQQKKGSFDPELLRMYMMGATNPGFSNKMDYSEDIIDLHLENITTGRVAPQDALFVQIENFEVALDKAIASGKLEFRVVHGLGKGKLKQEIYKILDKHPNVRSYENNYHSRYGYDVDLLDAGAGRQIPLNLRSFYCTVFPDDRNISFKNKAADTRGGSKTRTNSTRSQEYPIH